MEYWPGEIGEDTGEKEDEGERGGEKEEKLAALFRLIVIDHIILAHACWKVTFVALREAGWGWEDGLR